jgi:hypothetical protein
MFKNFNWPRITTQPARGIDIPFNYEPIIVQDNITYNGFFQSEQYFPDREFILNLFEPSDFINTKLQKYSNLFEGTTCSIHIRRGDYLKYSLHWARDITYYEQGIALVGNVDKYLIFSDDMAWCKTQFIGDHFIFIENEKDYVELFLQSKCNHNIISSSTFSWWGAYLNNKTNCKRIGPAQWFTNNMANDIVPESWQTI